MLRYDRHPRFTQERPEFAPKPERSFELPPVQERLQYPFLSIDPEAPTGTKLNKPQDANQLIEKYFGGTTSLNQVRGRPDVQFSSFNNRTLQVLLHFATRGRARALLYEALQHGTSKAELIGLKPLRGLTLYDWGSGRTENFARLVDSLGGTALSIDTQGVASDPHRNINRYVEQGGVLFPVSVITATHFVDFTTLETGKIDFKTAQAICRLLHPGGLLITAPCAPNGFTTDPCPNLPLEPSFGKGGKFYGKRTALDDFLVRRKSLVDGDVELSETT
ncbi:MAG: hypothetical protein KIH62_003710 [Candidatus Kerfeldbacteria bacterium]|nr:hypothetical protein [Candidatus Kerfeldbacteria bacterium]